MESVVSFFSSKNYVVVWIFYHMMSNSGLTPTSKLHSFDFLIFTIFSVGEKIIMVTNFLSVAYRSKIQLLYTITSLHENIPAVLEQQ